MTTITREVDEVESPEDDSVLVESNDCIRLSEEARKNLVAGVSLEENGIAEGKAAAEELGETLFGHKLNAEREEAWVQTIVLPGHESEGYAADDDEVVVEFLLPSGDTFSQAFGIPGGSYWDDDCEFGTLLDATGTSPSTVEKLPGSVVDTAYDDGEWSVDVESASESEAEVEPEPDVEEPHPTEGLSFFVVMLSLFVGMIGLQSYLVIVAGWSPEPAGVIAVLGALFLSVLIGAMSEIILSQFRDDSS